MLLPLLSASPTVLFKNSPGIWLRTLLLRNLVMNAATVMSLFCKIVRVVGLAAFIPIVFG